MEYSDNEDETQLIDAAADHDQDEDGWMYTHSSRGKVLGEKKSWMPCHELTRWAKSVSKTMDEIAHTIMDEEEEEENIKQRLESLDLEKPPLEQIPDMDDIPDIDDDFQVAEEEDPVSSLSAVPHSITHLASPLSLSPRPHLQRKSMYQD